MSRNSIILNYELTHLPINEEIVRAVIDHPQSTYADLEVMYWNVANRADLGGFASPLIAKLEERLGEIVLKGQGK